jgi:cysteine desulfurase
MKTYYFDAAATTPVRPEVLDAMMPYFSEKFYNPNSSYPQAYEVREDIEKAREVIANFINAEPNEIYFTSGGSESNCMALRGFRDSSIISSVFTTAIEHHSTLECVKNSFPKHVIFDVDNQGVFHPDDLEFVLNQYQDRLDFSHKIFSIIGANNEIGTIQDLLSIGSVTRRYGIIFHVDAVQMFGHSPIDVKMMDIDMLSASAHKIGGPKGCGFLYISNRVARMSPIIFGTQERALRGGTLNVPGIIGMAKATELCNPDNHSPKVARDYMIERLQHDFKCRLNGATGDHRLANNVNVTFPKPVVAEQLIYLLGESGVLCSAGSACNEGSPLPSHVLMAIGLSTDEAERTVRFTLPEDTTIQDVNEALNVLSTAMILMGVAT